MSFVSNQSNYHWFCGQHNEICWKQKWRNRIFYRFICHWCLYSSKRNNMILCHRFNSNHILQALFHQHFISRALLQHWQPTPRHHSDTLIHQNQCEDFYNHRPCKHKPLCTITHWLYKCKKPTCRLSFVLSVVCRQWTLLIPLVQHPWSWEGASGSHRCPSPTHFPLAVVIAERLPDMAYKSLLGNWHTGCAAGDHQRWAAVHHFSVFSDRTPSTQLFTCILTNKLRRIHDLTMSTYLTSSAVVPKPNFISIDTPAPK